MSIRPPIPLSLLVGVLLASVGSAGCGTTDQPPPSSSSAISSAASESSGATSATVASPITAGSVFAALDTYWGSAYPAAFGSSFVPLRGGEVPLDSGEPSGRALCIGSPGQISGNAYYCPDQDGIVYDTGVLVPVLIDHYGAVGLLTSLAHEYGHAVAARVGIAGGSPMVRELQADCLAGSFLAWAVSPAAPFGLDADDVPPAVAPLLDFGDQPTTEPTDAAAHGMALDRAQAVRLGYLDGPVACRDLTESSISAVLGRVPDPGTAGARFGSDSEIEQAALDSARATVDPDLPAATPSAPDVEAARVYGDFALAAATVLAAARTGTDGLGDHDAGCLTGRWTAAVFGTAGPDQLGGRPTDADQALNLVRTRPEATIDSLFGFVDGFAGRC